MRIPSIRPSRIASALAAVGLTASLAIAPAFADSRVVATIGADLTPAQQQTVIDYFGSNMNGADVIYVTNADEHAHLDGFIPYEQIGNATYSCALICPTASGGIRVRAANLNYVTADMLASALSSAGVRNADVIAICPFKVSGTGALTGVLLAYETATGQPLDPTKKDVATQELVVTQTISNQVGSDVATLIVNDVKAGVIMNGVTDESQIDAIVETTVNNVVNNVSNDTTINNVTNVDNSTTVIDNSTVNVTEVTINTTPGLTEEDIAALKELARSYAAADYNYDDMAETLATVSQNASASSGIADPMAEELANAAAAAQDSATSEADATDTPAAADGAGDADSAGGTGAADVPAAADSAGNTEAAPGTTGTDEEPAPGNEGLDASASVGTPTEPAEEAAPSIFDGTNNGALGDDVLVTATDEGAAADTTAADTALPGPLVPAQSAGVSLMALTTARASDLVDGTALVVFEESGQYGLASMVDGARRTYPIYTDAFQATDGLVVATQAADGKQVLFDALGEQLLGGSYDEIRVLNENWVLAIQLGSNESPSAVDVYYLPGSTAMPAATTTSDLLADARAHGDYLNVLAPDGTVSAYGANFTPVDGAAPAAIDDFSYAGDAGAGSAPQGADEPSPAEIADTQPLEGAQDAQPAEDAAASDEQPTEGTTATDGQPAAGMAATDEQVVSLPQDAVALKGTQGLLYTAVATDGKTHVLDAQGIDLFDIGFDQVIPARDGTVVVLVDKTANAAWAFEVEVPPTLQ